MSVYLQYTCYTYIEYAQSKISYYLSNDVTHLEQSMIIQESAVLVAAARTVLNTIDPEVYSQYRSHCMFISYVLYMSHRSFARRYPSRLSGK